jgi:hypothetical protein
MRNFSSKNNTDFYCNKCYFTEIDRDKRLSESPLVLRHQDTSHAPEFTQIFEACVSITFVLSIHYYCIQ